MNKVVIEEWARRLESGEYKQGSGALRTSKEEYCCLGVLCEIAVDKGIIPPGARQEFDDGSFSTVYSYGEHGDDNTAFLPQKVHRWVFGMHGSDDLLGEDGYRYSPVFLNDDKRLGFPEIAEHVRRTFEV